MMEKIIIAGDFVPQDRTLSLIKNGKYNEVLGQVKSLIDTADYSIVNLEAPLIDGTLSPISKTGPNLNAPIVALESIQYAGFNCVTLANNHFRDQGEKGVLTTLEECKKHNLDYVGAGHNLQEASKILFKSINGTRFAFINCCENEWSIASDNYGGSNPLNPINQYYTIQEAKQKADYVLVIVHGGIELYQYPTPRMQTTYRFFIDVGADVVINHHQHCICGHEIYKNKPIFYGLGNFCFDNPNYRNSIWNYGNLLVLKFDKNIDYELVPFVQCNETPCVDFNINSSFETITKTIDNRILKPSFIEEQFSIIIKSKSNVLKNFEPFSRNRFFSLLRRRRIIPSSFDSKKGMVFLNYFRCETYRDILIGLLSQKK